MSRTRSMPLGLHMFAVISLSLTGLFSAGCGSSEGSGNGSKSANTAASNGGVGTTNSVPVEQRGASSSTAVTTTGGPKMIDGIPYDVFFDKPLVIAANTQTGATTSNNPAVAANTPSNSTTSTETAPMTNVAPKPSGSAGASMKDIIDKELLNAQIKNSRNYLAGKAASVAVYNSSYLEIPPEAATLSMLAVAVSRYPEDFTWKKNAKHVRELSAKIAELTASKDGKTKNTFDAVADAFAKIDDILKGSEPAGLPQADDDKDFGDAVNGNVVWIMKRIKKSEEILKSTVSNEAGLKNDPEKVAQEGAMLAFLGAVIKSEGFGWGGDEEFASYAKPLIDGGKQIVEAAKSGNFSLYDEGMVKVAKSCNDCHPKFKP